MSTANAHRENSARQTPWFFLHRLGIATLLGCVFFTLPCIEPSSALARSSSDAAPKRLLSFLALGDIGFPVAEHPEKSDQTYVGKAMRRIDAKHPVDAVVFLGDLFYPVGLEETTAVTQIRDNLVRPYCRFVALDAVRSHEVARACRTRSKHVVPIFAVLGNHDYGSPGSPDRTQNLVPEFISNWKVPSEMVQVVEFDAGVSLILFDSQRVRYHGEDPSPLTDAIRQSRGPWRILVAHHPIATQSTQTEITEMQESYSRKILNAIAASGKSVQLVLAGHEHNLQVIELPAPQPALHIIAGSGGNTRGSRTTAADLKFFDQRLGFARIDLIQTAKTERLVASLYALSKYPRILDRAPTLVARYSVDRAGQVHNENKTDSHEGTSDPFRFIHAN